MIANLRVKLLFAIKTVPYILIFLLLTFSNFHSFQRKSYNFRQKRVLPSIQQISECECSRTFLWPPTDQIFSTCSDVGTFYEAEQKVVAFSLHLPPGSNNSFRKALYQKGIHLNLLAIRQNYPGYTMRLYTDTAIQNDFCEIVCSNSDLFWCDIHRTPQLGDQSEMFFMTWRFLPLGDPSVDIFLSRDLDSVVTPRESAVVQNWLQLSKKAIHVMRDKAIDHNIQMLGGMWGAMNSLLGTQDATILQRNIINMSRSMKKKKGMDQFMLKHQIFKARKQDIVAYDSYHCEYWRKFTLVRPFPTKRRNVNESGHTTDFVGNLNLGTRVYKFKKCPMECRPEYGKDWEYC